MKKVKVISLVLLIIVLVGVIACLLGFAIRSESYNKKAKNPLLTFDIDGYGEVQIELYPEYAPNTVASMVKLVENKYYDGKVFYGTDGLSIHAGMIRNEVPAEDTVETDDSTTKKNAVEDKLTASDLDLSIASGSENDYNVAIPGEFVANGYNDNTLRFEKGTVGLYRATYSSYYGEDLSAQSYNSGTALFFVCMEENSSINGLYAPFGKVVKGFDILEELNNLTTIKEENGVEGQIEYFEILPTIKTATVQIYGVDYGTPIYAEAFDYNSYLSDILLQYYQNQ